MRCIANTYLAEVSYTGYIKRKWTTRGPTGWCGTISRRWNGTTSSRPKGKIAVACIIEFLSKTIPQINLSSETLVDD